MKAVRSANLYQINKSKIAVLPQLFSFLLVIVCVGFGAVVLNTFFYIEAFAESIPFFRTTVNYQDPSDLLIAEQKSLINAQSLDDTSFSGLPVDTQCYMLQATAAPANLNPVISGQGIWWHTEVCDQTIQGIQVINGTPQELSIPTTGANYAVQFISDAQFAIIYGVTQDPQLDLSEVARQSAIIQTEQEQALAVDSQRVGAQKIYLTGKCTGEITNCQVWVSESFSSQSQMISDTLDQITHRESVLSENYAYVKIANTQDEFPEVVNIIYRNEFSNPYTLVRLDSNDGSVLQRLTITSEQRELYNKFYR
jgi:hypothetical protein